MSAVAVQSLTPEAQQKLKTYYRKQFTFVIILALILFLSAGRLDWALGWLHVALYAGFAAVQVFYVARHDPALAVERAKLQKGTKKWDLIITSLAVSILPMTAWVIAGLDARNGWTQPPLPAWVIVLGVALFIIGYGITVWAMRANTFFSATVRIQNDRNHRVMTGGPYRFVRHPGYVGAILAQIAVPLTLGSLPALIPSLISVVLFVVRTHLEDKTLHQELDGYAAYAAQTRYRLIPYVW